MLGLFQPLMPEMPILQPSATFRDQPEEPDMWMRPMCLSSAALTICKETFMWPCVQV